MEVYVECDLSGKRMTGLLMKSNTKTVWVVSPDKKIIKRHKDKHNVVIKSAI